MRRKRSDPDQFSLDFELPIAVRHPADRTTGAGSTVCAGVVERTGDVCGAVSDDVAEALVAARLTTRFRLQNEKSIPASVDTLTEWPWSLPSRLYQAPLLFVPSTRTADRERIYAVLLEDLLRHPFVERVVAKIGLTPIVSDRDLGGMDFLWLHAVDLATERHWRHLLATRTHTLPEHVADAVRGAMATPAVGATRRLQGRLSTATARSIMEGMGWPEPGDRSEGLLRSESFDPTMANCMVRPKPASDGPAGAWATMHAIEDRWVKRGGSGRLERAGKCGSTALARIDIVHETARAAC